MIETPILTTLKIAVLAFVTLFPIVNPLGDAPIFLQLTRQYTCGSDRRRPGGRQHRLAAAESIGRHRRARKAGHAGHRHAERLLSADSALTVGPGTISVAITIGAHVRQMAGERYLARFPLFLSALFGMAGICVLVWLCYGNAGKLVHVLGPTGTTIVTRLSSFILMAIGVQIMWNGMSAAVGHALSFSAADNR